MPHTHPVHTHHTAPHAADSAALAQILELDAQALAEHTAAVIAWLPVRTVPRAVVDLGAGTGAGTFALLGQFPDAHVTAVDSSVDHLARLREKACATGRTGRIDTIAADLDAGTWPDLGTPDLVWASASLHHLADPVGALGKVGAALEPDGLLAVVELAGLPRFLPPTAPAERPGLEDRCHDAADVLHAGHLPHRGADWAPLLSAAGLTVEDVRTFAIEVPAAENPAVGRYALATLRQLRERVAAMIPAEDRTALDRLLDTTGPHSILDRADLTLRTERTVWAARRTA